MFARSIATSCVLISAATIPFQSFAAERLHPVEKVCISYQMQGPLMKGGTTRCHRQYGFESFEIQDMEVGVAGLVQKQQSHNISIGDQLYSIDRATNTGTVTTNPMYAPLVRSIEQHGNNAEAIGKAFMSGMDFQPTGQRKDIAGKSCNVLASPNVGRICLSDDALMLEQDFAGMKQIAVEVAVGEDGGEENYELYQTVQLRQGVDLSEGFDMQSLINQAGGQAGTAADGGVAPEIPAGLQDLLKSLPKN